MASMHRAADAVLLQTFYDHDIQLLHHVPLPGNILYFLSCYYPQKISNCVVVTPRKLPFRLLLPP